MNKSSQEVNSSGSSENVWELVGRLALVLVFLYLFLIGVKSLEMGIKMLGGGFAKGLFTLTSHPIGSLLAGMLATVLLQSSSVTTSIVVGLVSAGSLSITGAVPMVMGANLGTSVTNTLVSLGHARNKEHFGKAFAAGTIHDMFNILSVIVILPIELATGFLQKLSTYTAHMIYGKFSGAKISGPLKSSLKAITKKLNIFITETLGLEANIAAIAVVIVAAACIFLALYLIVRDMQVIVERHKGDLVDRFLGKNPFYAILLGILVTVSVQSSSITTSLLVPMAGSGMLTLEAIFPVTIGANIGTTATALIAAMAGNVFGLTIALVHFFFNITGTLIWFVIPFMRKVPLKGAELLGSRATQSRRYALAYISMLFLGIPSVVVLLSQ